jgi:hypothetical protein
MRRSARALSSINSRGLLPIISIPPRASGDLIGDAALSELFPRPLASSSSAESSPRYSAGLADNPEGSGLSYSSEMSLLV